jgi:hypothetical protein
MGTPSENWFWIDLEREDYICVEMRISGNIRANLRWRVLRIFFITLTQIS